MPTLVVFLNKVDLLDGPARCEQVELGIPLFLEKRMGLSLWKEKHPLGRCGVVELLR